MRDKTQQTREEKQRTTPAKALDRRVLVIFRRLWRGLTEPTSAVVDAETRLKSRWLSSIFVILLPFGAFIASIPPLVDAEPPWHVPQVVGVFGMTLLLSVGYYLNRRGRYELASTLTLFIVGLYIFISSPWDNNPDNIINDSAYLIATLLFSSILLRQRFTAMLFVVYVIALLLIPIWSPQVPLGEIIKQPLSLMITMYALIVFGTNLRNALEKHHVRLLQAENAERRRAEEHLRAALAQKEVLLKEIHHRVKNNLQIISSLLSLQLPSFQDPVVLAHFQDSQSRIRSMALIHERLYRSDDLSRIDFGPYLRDLTGHLMQSYEAQHNAVTLQVETDTIYLDIDTAIPCGLLVNELVSNALKHAFPDGQKGEIQVEMRCRDDGYYRLTVQDKGVGFSPGLDFRKTASLGLQLVNSLVRQLRGRVDLETDAGTTFVIDFPMPQMGKTIQRTILNDSFDTHR